MQVRNGEITIKSQCYTPECKNIVKIDLFTYLLHCFLNLKYLCWNPMVLCDEHHEFFSSGTCDDQDPNTNPQFKNEQDEKSKV